MTMKWSKNCVFFSISPMTFLFLFLLVFATHAAHAQPPQAQVMKVDLLSTYYTERKGENADYDLDKIRTPPGYRLNPPEGQSRYAPGCFLKGNTTFVEYDVQNNTSQPLGVVIVVDLANRDDGEVYWSGFVGSPTVPLPPAGFLILPELPNHIANATMHFTFYFYLQGMGVWMPAGSENVPNPPDEIVLHTVLGPPQPSASMDVPWDEVLHIACKWMSRTSTASAALQKLTERMMGVKRDNSSPPKAYIDDGFAVWRYKPEVKDAMTFTQWIRDPATNKVDKEMYLLRRWLNYSNNGEFQKEGQCTEVSALWVIMATAVGCDVQPQIINEPEPPNSPNPPDDFHIKSGYWAGRTAEGLLPYYDAVSGHWYPIGTDITDPNIRPTFNYHQVGWANIYDVAIGYSGSIYYIGHDSNGNGILDPGEYLGTGALAKLAINVAINDYCDTAWLWAGVGNLMYRFKNPPLLVDFNS
jgi:hypothetical protein